MDSFLFIKKLKKMEADTQKNLACSFTSTQAKKFF